MRHTHTHTHTHMHTHRYETTSNGVQSYGWLQHDGRSFGHQKILDTDLGLFSSEKVVYLLFIFYFFSFYFFSACIHLCQPLI